MSRHYQVTVDGRTFEIDLIARSVDSVEFVLNKTRHHVTISTPAPLLKREVTQGSPQSTLSSSTAALQSTTAPTVAGAIVAGAVNAPMPGIIAKILVTVGDAVIQGQPLIVVEAMKMENSIPSPLAGIVKKLEVVLGNEVKKGQLLVVIE